MTKRTRVVLPARERPLWRCPRCGHELAGRNMSHSCGVHDLEEHFRGKPPEVRRLFDALVDAVRAFGPFKVEAQKTRIVFQVRVRFVAALPRRTGLGGHFWLTRAAPGPPVTRVEKIPPRSYIHHFRIERVDEIDASMRERLREAYGVGEQRHLEASR
jgi:uncharacterized protein DUF5655